MNANRKREIANSFPALFETNRLNLEISNAEFDMFEKGIFAGSMDDKWNVFVLDGIIYFARSWTGYCIYKVSTMQRGNSVTLSEFDVNRNLNEYRGRDMERDTVQLKKLLQLFLNREGFYSDPKLELPLIKETIEKVDPNNDCKKSIGSNNVGLTRQIYNGLSTREQEEYFEIIGWTELKEVIAEKEENEPLISLYIQNREDRTSATYYFDQDAAVPPLALTCSE